MEVKIVSCKKDGDFLYMKQEDGLENIKNIKEKNLIGYGIHGHAVASVYAVLSETSVTFCRNEDKSHGTMKRIDGHYIIPEDECILFCERKKEAEAMECLKGYNITNKYFFDVVSEPIDNLKPWQINDSNFHVNDCENIDISEYVQCLDDREFILSSGKKASVYYETLPASNNYDAVKSVCEFYKNDILSHETIVAIGYGGIYLGAFAALHYNKEFLVYYDSGANKKITRNSVMFLDDYITTGKSILKAVSCLEMKEKPLAIVMYAKEKCDILGVETRIKQLIKTN